MDISDVKLFVKNADDALARDLYGWMTGAMEIRGIIPIQGAAPTRKRRSDAGVPRTETPAAGDQLPLREPARNSAISAEPGDL